MRPVAWRYRRKGRTDWSGWLFTKDRPTLLQPEDYVVEPLFDRPDDESPVVKDSLLAHQGGPHER